MNGEKNIVGAESASDLEGRQSPSANLQGPTQAALPEVYLTGIGTCLGSTKVPLEEIGRRFNLTDKDLVRLRRKCGPQHLYRIGDGQTLVQCALDACRRAMSSAALQPDAISGVYASTGGPVAEYALPDLARVLALSMGLDEIDTIPISMGCVGGIDGLLAARNRLIVDSLEGRAANYLVVCGDQATVTHRETDRDTAFLFSEGMACCVLSNRAQTGFRIEKINSMAAGGDPFCMKLQNAHLAPQAKFEMSGEAVYEFVIKTALPKIPSLLGLTRFPTDTYCIFHQASFSILRQLASQADLASDLVYSDGIREIGNTSGASVMFGLHDAVRKGYVLRASRVLLAAFGVSLKVGAALLTPVGDPRNVTLAA
jgi:3-oxoacyl-[acyl-carrier-protein] synthase-3